MSLADNKRSIFTTIGSYSSLIEEGKRPRQSDLFPSINNKDDIVPFLLDVLKTVAGTEVLKENQIQVNHYQLHSKLTELQFQ